MKYKVVVGNLWIGAKKYKRGDEVDLTEQEAGSYGVKLEPVPEKPKKRGRPKKVEVASED